MLIVRGMGDASMDADVAGGVGRNWFASQVQAAGGVVQFLVAYQRCQPDWSAPDRQLVLDASHDGTVWLFSSSEAIANLLSAFPDVVWTQARAVATHPRIAQAARAAGFAVVCESRPVLADLVASIESL